MCFLNIKDKILLGMLAIVFLTACGGGSDDSSSSPSPSPTPVPDGVPPTAKILFPPKLSAVSSSQVIIRGVAKDASGIEFVTVNGKNAAIFVRSNNPPNSVALSSGLSKIEIMSNEEEVEWEITLELEAGETEVEVSVGDKTTEITEKADAATIHYFKVPTDFSLIAGESRVVGITNTKEVVDYDFNTGTQTNYGLLSDASNSDTCFRAGSNDLYYRSQDAVGFTTSQVKKYNLNTMKAEKFYLETYEPPLDKYNEVAFFSDLTCDDSSDHIFFYTQYPPLDNSDGWSHALRKVSLSDPGSSEILFQNNPDAPNPFFLNTLTLVEGRIVASTASNDDHRIASFSIESGEYQEIFNQYDAYLSSISAGSTFDELYAIDLRKVFLINTSEDTVSIVSEVKKNDLIQFSQIEDSVFDSERNRLIVGDSSLESLIAIDVVTGERSTLLTTGVGDGVKIIAPQGMAFDSEESTVYIFDSGGNAAQRVVKIDIETASRSQFGSSFSSNGFDIGGLVLNEELGYLYVATGRKVFSIDLDTEETLEIASSFTGSGVEVGIIHSLKLNPSKNSLLYTDSHLEAIVEINLETFERTVLSQHDARGSGESFSSAIGLTIDSVNNIAYVSNSLGSTALADDNDVAANTIMAVDLETGNRSLVDLACEGIGDHNLRSVHYNQLADELFILSFESFVVDMKSGSCQKLGIRSITSDIFVTGDGSIFTLGWGALEQFDRESQQTVAISK